MVIADVICSKNLEYEYPEKLIDALIKYGGEDNIKAVLKSGNLKTKNKEKLKTRLKEIKLKGLERNS